MKTFKLSVFQCCLTLIAFHAFQMNRTVEQVVDDATDHVKVTMDLTDEDIEFHENPDGLVANAKAYIQAKVVENITRENGVIPA